MAELASDPQARYRNGAYQRAQRVKIALHSMRHGGTAADVRDAYISQTNDPVSVNAIKESLWHLHALGYAHCETDNRARWWTSNDRAREN